MRIIPLCLVLAAACAVDEPTVESDEAESISIGKGNSCGNQWTTPVVLGHSYSYPMALNPNGTAPIGYGASAGRFERGGIQYVSGQNLNLSLVTDGCTFIRSVTLGSLALTKINTGGYWYEDWPGATTPPTTNLYLHFLPRIEGASDLLTITVGRIGGSGFTTWSVPLVRVARVEAAGVNAAVSISPSEIQNMFASSLYTTFNGAANRTTVSGLELYDYNPASLSVTIGTKIFFHFEFKASSGICDPTLFVDGSFHILANQDNPIAVQWSSGPIVTPHWPSNACVIAAWVLEDAVDYVTDEISAAIAEKISAAVGSATNVPADARQFLRGATTKTDELDINMSLQVPSISVHPAYDPSFPSSIHFPAGDRIGLFASGLGVRQYFTSPNNHWSISGPNGLPRSASVPGTHTLPRTSTVSNSEPVGRLLARTTLTSGETATYVYSPGCGLRVPTLSPFVKLAPNDTVGGAFQGGRHHVRALFLTMNSFIEAGAAQCASDGGGVIGLD